MAVVYHFDLYPRDDPRDGARLVRFTQLQLAEYRDEANGTGSGRIALRADSDDAAFIDPDGLQYVRVVRDRLGVENVVGGFWLDNGDFDLLTAKNGRLITFGGAGTLAYLQRAQMWSHVYFSTYPGIFSADDPVDGVYSADLMTPRPRLGYIFWRWMIQATLFRSGTTPYTHRHFDGVLATDIHEDDRTENPLPDLTLGFDDDHDSDGNVWSNPFGDFEVPVGEDMLTVAQRCMQAGLYVSMDPDTFELNAWDVEDHRRDRTGLAWATDVVRFQAPTDADDVASGNIKSDTRRSLAPFVQRSVVLAGTGNAYRRSSTLAGDIAWEGFAYSASDDDDFLERVAATQLRARADATDTIRLRMRLESDRENGAYLPFEHVRVDDLVTVHTGIGPWDLDDASFPVAAITITQLPAGNFDAWVELGAAFTSMTDRRFSVAGPPTRNRVPNPRLCTRRNLLLGLQDASLKANAELTGFTREAACDGDPDSFWTDPDDDGVPGGYWAADLGSSQTAEAWRLTTDAGASEVATAMEIYGSNDPAAWTWLPNLSGLLVGDPAANDWELIGGYTGGTAPFDSGERLFDSGTPKTYRYWLFLATDGPGPIGGAPGADWNINEVELWSGLTGSSPDAARCDHPHTIESLLAAPTDTDLVLHPDGAGGVEWGADAGGVDEIEDLPTAETDTSLVLHPDGAGGVVWGIDATGAGGTVRKRKTSNQAVTSTSFIDVTDLTFTVLANTNYHFRFAVFLLTSATTEGYALSVNGPAGTYKIGGIIPVAVPSSSGQGALHGAGAVADTTGLTVISGPGGSAVMALVEGTVAIGGSGGTLALRVKTENGGAQSTTIQTGSYGEVSAI